MTAKLTTTRVRIVFAVALAVVLWGTGPAGAATEILNLAYGPNPRHRLDIYLPETRASSEKNSGRAKTTVIFFLRPAAEDANISRIPLGTTSVTISRTMPAGERSMTAKLTTTRVRIVFAVALAVVLWGTGPAGAATEILNLAYGPNPRHRLDIYLPETRASSEKNSGRAKTTVIFFHGGSWRRGSRERYKFVGRAITKLGYVAVLANL